MTSVDYRRGNDLDLDTVIRLYDQSTLGERRPINDRERMRRMLMESNLVITAWGGDQLLGIARSLSDFVFATYLADLAVHAAYQKKGLGRELIRQTHLAAPRSRIILLAAPKAVRYYPHIGFEPHPSAWVLDEGATLE